MRSRIQHVGVFLVVLALGGAASAEPPPDVNYQGRLLDGAGQPLPGPINLQIRIFDQPSGGTQLYAEDHQNITLQDGVFRILLGTGTNPQGRPFGAQLFEGTNRWLEMMVEAEVLNPRQPFTSVAYAFQATNAQDAMTVGAIPSGELVTTKNLEATFASEVNQIAEAQIPDQIARDSELASKSDVGHEHDGRYYTQAQVHGLLVAQEARIAALESLLAGVTRAGDLLTFSGMNVQVVNGLDQTETKNSLGNLIVGYNEERDPFFGATDRTGSHNLVVGSGHNYTAHGGLVAGRINTISGAFASVIGGQTNTASGGRSSVTGGTGNVAQGNLSSVTGGSGNRASGGISSVTGGSVNTASGNSSTVSGGAANTASGLQSSVSGGQNNEAHVLSSSVSGGEFNDATGEHSSVSGGLDSTASGDHASVSGGFANGASGRQSSVCGGEFNTASHESSTVSGGEQNSAGGNNASVSGGSNRSVFGPNDWRAGDLFQTE